MAMLDWLDTHSGSLVATATLVLVAVTAYYAWTTAALVRESHTSLQAAARATLQERLDRLSVLFIQDPRLFADLSDDAATGEELDSRFHIANVFLGILEEAHTQYHVEHSMSADDWEAWATTADTFLSRPYVTRYWRRVALTYEPAFRRFVDARLRSLSET